MRQHWIYSCLLCVIALSSLYFYYLLYRVIIKNSENHFDTPPDKTKSPKVMDFDEDFEANPFFRKWKNVPCQSCSIPEMDLLIDNTNRCLLRSLEIKMLFLINSKSSNVQHRKSIRETWARRDAMNKYGMTYVFVVGIPGMEATEGHSSFVFKACFAYFKNRI